MDKIVNGVTYRNVEKFIKFLDDNLKCPYGSYDLNACLEELVHYYCISGNSSYELSPFETKSKLPECIDYEVKDTPFYRDADIAATFEDADSFFENADYYESEIIF